MCTGLCGGSECLQRTAVFTGFGFGLREQNWWLCGHGINTVPEKEMQHVLVWGDKEQTKPDSCIAIVWAVLRTDEICLHHSFSLPFSMGCRNHSADSISLLFHVRGASPKSLDNLYNHFSIYHVLHYMTAKSNSPVCYHRAPEAQAERRAKSQQGCHFQTTQKHWNALRCIINGSCVLGVSCTW